MNKYSEITFEITNYCPHSCKSCSSDSVDKSSEIEYLPFGVIESKLLGVHYTRIIISGGEPLYHPKIGLIIELCRYHCDDLVIYSNMITHIIYNAAVIDGITVEANLNLNDNVEKVHILKRVNQGRQITRPEVQFSGNWDHNCHKCGKEVMIVSGEMVPSPCNKKPLNR